MPVDDFRDKHICIIGSLRFQNHALACYLSESLGVECTELTLENDLMLPEDLRDKQSVLFLIDGVDENLEEKLAILEGRIRDVLFDYYICFFNIRPDRRLDEQTLNRRVHGIFYVDDDIQHLGRGIRAVFGGELWIPRRILSSIIRNHAGGWKSEEIDPDILTPREIEVLYLLVTGHDQNMIGEKLFISPHTVRTHLSNVFRKIGVKNRLEAKIWFEKNREALRTDTKKVRLKRKTLGGKD